jgi:hypothetical protein
VQPHYDDDIFTGTMAMWAAVRSFQKIDVQRKRRSRVRIAKDIDEELFARVREPSDEEQIAELVMLIAGETRGRASTGRSGPPRRSGGRADARAQAPRLLPFPPRGGEHAMLGLLPLHHSDRSVS